MIAQNSDAYYITTSRYFAAPDQNLLDHYNSLGDRTIIPITRNNKTVYNVFIYRLKDAKSAISIND